MEEGSWSSVFKVKYGDILRRFTVKVHDNRMDHDIAKLKTKISALFNISPDTTYSLTYTDEDGDMVTLVNDEELLDAVVSQRMNPLRINVLISSNSPNNTSTEKIPSPTLNATINEALKSVPDPLKSVINDVAFKATEASPALAEFVELFSRLGMAQGRPSQSGQKPNKESKKEVPIKEYKVEKKASSSQENEKPLFDLNELLKSVPHPLKSVLNDLASKALETSPAFAEFVENFSKLGMDQSGPSDSDPKPSKESKKEVHIKECKVEKNEADYQGLPQIEKLTLNLHLPHQELPAFKDSFESFDETDSKIEVSVGQSERVKASTPISYPSLDEVVKDEGRTDPPPLQGKRAHYLAPPLRQEGLGMLDGSIPKIRRGRPRMLPPLLHDGRPSLHSSLGTFHRGVRCDGCGMHPIMGPRFKSRVKENYDLCIACFSKIGTEADYIRIDHSHHHGPRSLNSTEPYCTLPKGKLDSRFVVDVTVMDGTSMAPSTSFMKIWKMRNNGSIEWPAGTQLLWIGGDPFADVNSVTLEIPQAGHPVGGEIDIAVNFTAPARPGRYISYWKMASPSGLKFGQRVWVLIQVDDSFPEPTRTTVEPEIDLNLLPTAQAPPPPVLETVPAEPTAPTPTELPAHDVAGPATPPLGETSTGVNSVEHAMLKELEEMGFKQREVNVEILRANNYDMDKCVDELCGISEWDPLLEELREMGFEDREKNKELLVKNGGSIKRVVLELVNGEDK